MSYSGASTARAARERLSQALAALQTEANIPDDVMAIAAEVAQAVGALFEAERAASDGEGQATIKRAMSFLTQTLTLLQAVHSTHPGVERATESIATVMGTLYPLSVASLAQQSPADATRRLETQPSAVTTAPRQAPVQPSPAPVVEQAPPAHAQAPVVEQAPPRREPEKPKASVAYAPRDVPLDVPPKTGPVSAVEANIGATTESNFYIGFSGQVTDGGVFLATYEVLPRGSWANVLVTLPGGFEFRCDAWVRFVRDPLDFASGAEPGMGLQFDSLTDEARELVLRFIRKRPPLFFDE
jgi:hypothetical protein